MRTQILYSDSFVSWIKTRLCICAIDGIVLTSSFAVILQLQTKKRSGLCDNPLMKPSRQQAQWAAYFSQYRNCAIPSCQPNSKAFGNSSVLAVCANIYVTLFVTAQCNDGGRVSERHPSSQLSTIDEFYHKKTLECNRKRKLSRMPEKPDGSSHKCRKDKTAARTCMNSRGPLKTSSSGRTHEMRNELERYTHQLECNSDFSAWDVNVLVSLNSRGILDVTQARSYYARGTSNSWRPRMRFKSVVGDRWSTAFSWAIAWFCLDVPLSPINRLQHPFQCQWFGQLRLVKDAVFFSNVIQMLQHNGFRWDIVQWVPLVDCGIVIC